ncbi:MAG: shikimate kinase [Rhodospirillales bacterium]|nr:shikimate kinase [Rhodospirillales bacterium]MCB9964972.1 shikimate kinase [Rhodospirillales bacterium]
MAESLGYRFYDSDQMIEEKTGMTIPEIFAQKGEPWFRQIEREVILGLVNGSDADPYILSTGGGAVMTPEIHDALYDKTIMIYISASPETLWERLESSTTRRPLLQGDPEQAREKLKNLLDARHPVYIRSHLIISSDKMPVDKVVDLIKTEVERG